MTRRHIVLVGLPGSGKSTVGRLVAEALSAQFVDLDRLVEARVGRSVERIFAERGEAAFRVLESEAGASVLLGEPVVFAPGGGFVTDESGRLRARSVGFLVYLQTAPSVAARRLDGQTARPLLKGYDATLRLAQLLEQRKAAYLEAAATVNTDHLTPDQVAEKVAALARSDAGW